MRILIIGSPGAGKSTLARRLASRFDLPLIHLDREYFGPGWVEPARSEWRDRVSQLVAQPRWVMDGNYRSTFDLRIPRATAVVWLDLPRWRCLFNALARVARYYGRTRPDLGPGCIERFDLAFLRWTWTFPQRARPAIVTTLEHLGPGQTAFVLRSWSEAEAVERHLAAVPKAA